MYLCLCSGAISVDVIAWHYNMTYGLPLGTVKALDGLQLATLPHRTAAGTDVSTPAVDRPSV